jgi:hypothetical protein
MMSGVQSQVSQVPFILRSDAGSVSSLVERRESRQIVFLLIATIAGSMAFGAVAGCWRSPLQAFYTAVKFPLLILLTVVGNAMLNGMLAPLLGVRIGMRDSLLAVLLSFAIAGIILGGMAPLLGFVIWNVPKLGSERSSAYLAYRFMQLMIVGLIAVAGVAANVRLFRYVEFRGRTRAAALRLLLGWLAGNLLLGSQICWILRPFIGRPQDDVIFLMADPFQGNFFETCWEAAKALLMRNAEVGP